MRSGKDSLNNSHIGAVVLAAGMSRRMGRPKLVLPWGNHTVIWQVVDTLDAAGVRDIVVVTGAARELVEKALDGMQARLAYNPGYEDGEMLHSLQVGIQALLPIAEALLVTLGDQPMIEAAAIRRVAGHYLDTGAQLVIPSYQMRRGHPWLVGRKYWNELLSMPANQTMHDFIQRHADEIHYIVYDSPSILEDMDTPEDYQQNSP